MSARSECSSRSFLISKSALSRENRDVVNRARRLERFLTQPFFTTEAFTGTKGKAVALADTLAGCERILADELREVPERSLYMIGQIDEALAHAT